MTKSTTLTTTTKINTLGWREWVALPDIGITRIKAKIDTGARTSTLHAFQIKPYKKNKTERVLFSIHPKQKDMKTIIQCDAEITDIRWVSDSGGHTEERYVIYTTVLIGQISKQIEITLTNRDSMRFRMLLGRTALTKDFMVNPAASFLMGK